MADLCLAKPAGIAMVALTIRKECYYCCLWRSNPSETANIFSVSANDCPHARSQEYLPSSLQRKSGPVGEATTNHKYWLSWGA